MPAQGPDSLDCASEGCHLGGFGPEMAHKALDRAMTALIVPLKGVTWVVLAHKWPAKPWTGP